MKEAEELRESVSTFRNPVTPEAERQRIQQWWESNGIPNQFAAMLRAAEVES